MSVESAVGTQTQISKKDVAVLIPVFNNPVGLARSLASLAAGEARERLSVLVVDDGSTPPIALPAIDGLDVQVLRLAQNGGITRALNAGLAHILAEPYTYVARLDAGDCISPIRFTVQTAFFERHPDCSLVGSYVDMVDMAGRPVVRFAPDVEDDRIAVRMHQENVFPHPSVMMRCEALRELGGYSEAYPHIEDYELFWRMADRGRVALIPQVLVAIEINPAGITLSKRKPQLVSRLRLQWERFDPRVKESYVGLAITLMSFVLPEGVAIAIKKLLALRPRRRDNTPLF